MKKADFKPGTKIKVSDRMQRCTYTIQEKPGTQFDSGFKPELTPQQMLRYGVFEGKYLNDCTKELPEEWFKSAKLSDEPDPSKNYFQIKSRQGLSVWKNKGWIVGQDVRGWFQWYCRYWLGRRDPEVDAIQIKRWRAFTRHAGQIKANCKKGDLNCRPKQRQALLQWGYNPFI